MTADIWTRVWLTSVLIGLPSAIAFGFTFSPNWRTWPRWKHRVMLLLFLSAIASTIAFLASLLGIIWTK